MSEYNEELFRKVLGMIKHDKSLWNQENFRQSDFSSSCGTTCCIAGWAVTLTYGKFIPVTDPESPFSGTWVLPGEHSSNMETEGKNLLGLTWSEVDKIFYYITDEDTLVSADEDGYEVNPPVTYNQMVTRIMEVTGLDLADLLDSEETEEQERREHIAALSVF